MPNANARTRIMNEEHPPHAEPRPDPRSALERHAQTLILSVVTGLIFWIGVSVTSSRESLARMEVRIDSMEMALQELKSARESAYTRIEADRTHAEIERRLENMEGRLTQLEHMR